MHLYSYLHRKGKLIEHHTFTLFIFFKNDLSAGIGAGFTVSNNKKEPGVVVRNK